MSQPARLQFPELAELLGERYSESSFERSFYRRDLAYVPSLLGAVLARTMPHAVARPGDAVQVAATVRYAAAHHVPVTPRSAATTVYWNTVPVRGGLVIDLNGLRGAPAVDRERMSATVPAATRWGELDDVLQRQGLATLCYPTSAPSATVGGWVSMEGYGIGSCKYGGLEGQLKRLQVVLPNGELQQVTPESDPPLGWFVHAEGTLGIITEVELAIRLKPAAIGQHVVTLENPEALGDAVAAMTALSPAPYNIHFSDHTHMEMLRRAGFTPTSDKSLVAVTVDGSEEEVANAAQGVARVAAAYGGQELGCEPAELEWVERFTHLRTKRGGPTLLGVEAWLPTRSLNSYLAAVAQLGREQRLEIGTYGTVATPTMVSVMSMFPSNEKYAISYTLGLSLTNRLYESAFRFGGRPYGIGFWNAPYLAHAYSAQEIAERRRRKHRLDPENIMNPGKVYKPAFLLTPPIFDIGMHTLSWVRRLGRWGG